jgi:uncharacterized phage protein (TIGR01671 family)
MNREIKFRAWDKTIKKMFYNIQELYDGMGDITDRDGNDLDIYESSISQSFDCALNNKDMIVEQYTGLKDKNGKEIYEGDIITAAYVGSSIGRVVYHKGSFKINFNVNNEPYVLLEQYAERNNFKVEVIGNIYEATEEQLKEWCIN